MVLIKHIKEHWLILLILMVGILYRFIPINQYQFSHDELSGLSRTVFPNLYQEINYGIKVDAHPAFIQLFLWLWVKLFGYNEIAIKLPFLLCGVLSIWVIYRFAKTYLNEAAALVSATVISCSFIFLLYSSYARMYMPGILFSILLLQSVFKIIFSDEVNTKDYLFFVVWSVLCAYTHHITCFFSVVVALLSLFYIQKERLRKFLLFSVISILIYLPHISITMYQLSVGGIGFSSGGWLAKPEITVIYHFVKTLLGCGISGKVTMLLFFLLMFISIFRLNPISKKQLFLLWVFVINYSIIYIYSIVRNPILQFSVLLFCGITLVLFLSSFTGFLSKKQITVLCLVLICLMSFQNIRKKHFFTKVNSQEFEMQAQTILKMQRIVGKNNVTAILGSEPFFVYTYEKKFHTKWNYLSTHDSIFINKQKFNHYLKHLNQKYIVLCSVGAGAIQQVKQYFPYIVSNTDDYFSNVTVLSKYDYGYYDVSVKYPIGLLNSDVNLYLDSTQSITFYNDSFEFKVTPKSREYPFNLSIPMSKTMVAKNQSLIAELDFIADSDSITNKDELCAAVFDSKGNTIFYTSTIFLGFYNSNKNTQKAVVEIFVGSEFDHWKREDAQIGIFIKKGKKSAYTFTNFKLSVADYNPTKWTLWN